METPFFDLLAIVSLFVVLPALYLAARFFARPAVTYAAIEDHFKYGSTGASANRASPTGSGACCRRYARNILPKTDSAKAMNDSA